jgi:hypothetical protein
MLVLCFYRRSAYASLPYLMLTRHMQWLAGVQAGLTQTHPGV